MPSKLQGASHKWELDNLNNNEDILTIYTTSLTCVQYAMGSLKVLGSRSNLVESPYVMSTTFLKTDRLM